MLARIAALDDALLPVVLQRLGRDPGGARMRERAEIADAGMDMKDAVRRDATQTVEAVEARCP
jgi:hypothetical protein